MPGIVWLASYPKSGNTWLRAFLANYLANGEAPVPMAAIAPFGWSDGHADHYEQLAGRPLAALTDAEVQSLRPRVHRAVARMRHDALFVKTHNAMATVAGVPMITREHTAGAIYLVRNPLDVVPSYADHFGLSVDAAIAAIGHDRNYVPTQPHFAFQLLGSWSGHVRSWTRAGGLRLLTVRYEDLARSPAAAFRRVVRFLGLPCAAGRLERAIQRSSFATLSALERRSGFGERSAHSARFFRSGRVGGWRSALTGAQVERVVRRHAAVMREQEYLDAGERILV